MPAVRYPAVAQIDPLFALGLWGLLVLPYVVACGAFSHWASASGLSRELAGVGAAASVGGIIIATGWLYLHMVCGWLGVRWP